MRIKYAQIFTLRYLKSAYALKEGRGYSISVRKRTSGGGNSKSIRTPLYLLKWCFHIFTAFVFYFLNGKVKTLTP